MKQISITSSLCDIGFECARFRVDRRTAVVGASIAAALIFARMSNTHPKWQRRVCADPTIVVTMEKTRDTVRCFGS